MGTSFASTSLAAVSQVGDQPVALVAGERHAGAVGQPEIGAPHLAHELDIDDSRAMRPHEALGALDESVAHTWKWDGAAWTRVATTGPPPRFVSAMAYDAARAEVVLFGGSVPDGYLGDTWVWDGTAWHER